MEIEIVDIADERLFAIPVMECGEPLVDVAGSSIVYGEPPEYPETAPGYRLVREGVLSRLERAQAALPKDLHLRLYEGYRSPQVQARIFSAQLARTTVSNPSYTQRQCFSAAARLASPLYTFEGNMILPPHSTGGAVDVEIVDRTGNVIEFGMEIKDWATVGPERCATGFPELVQAARRNRDLLVNVMSKAGFINYPREWWHFSYGDKYWAFVKDRPHALYTGVELTRRPV
ncbi:M15 family metallopeptidase [Allohahella marinimesophila]|uniref:D-alanyl-D-alanine dipeptidase n=2 Tax=Allohahella marinimesophila TaxID=1054972 RepID=A0ABP7PGG2_9GAMM